MNHVRNAAWMQERGHKVAILCVTHTPIEAYAVKHSLKVIHIAPHKKYYDFKKGNILANLLQVNHFTHLLIRTTLDMSITAIVKRKLGAKIHTSYFMEMQLGVKKKHVLHTMRFKYIDLWSCPLNWLKKQVETMTHYSNELVVIPSGLDLSPFNTIISQKEAREQLNLPQDVLIFGLIGRFDPQKGQLLLLEALKKCTNNDFHVVLLGEPTKDEGEAYFNLMRSIIDQVKDRVHIRPFMNDVTIFFSAVDWFVMATKAETFGMVTIESLAAGTPVLGSNAGGTPEILDDEKSGKLFESMNASSLAHSMDEICRQNKHDDPAIIQKMAEVYDHNTVCEKVEKALHIR